MDKIDRHLYNNLRVDHDDLRERFAERESRMVQLEDKLAALTAKAAEFEERALAAEAQIMAMCDREIARTGTISAMGIGLDAIGCVTFSWPGWMLDEEE